MTLALLISTPGPCWQLDTVETYVPLLLLGEAKSRGLFNSQQCLGQCPADTWPPPVPGSLAET